MADDGDAPGVEDIVPVAEGSVEVELARALAAAKREIYWLRRERQRLLDDGAGTTVGELDGGADVDADNDGPAADDILLGHVARQAVYVAARRLATGEARSDSTTWDRLTEAMRDVYLARATAAVEAVVPVFAQALDAIPGLAEVRLAQHRLGLPPESALSELLDHARAEGSARVLNDVARDARDRNIEHEALRKAIQAVELVIVDGEHMASSHSSPVAVEVAEWFTDRLRRSLAEPDVTLSDALAAEREQVLLAVAEQLGYTGIVALSWYTEMSSRIDAGPPD